MLFHTIVFRRAQAGFIPPMRIAKGVLFDSGEGEREMNECYKRKRKRIRHSQRCVVELERGRERGGEIIVGLERGREGEREMT